MNWEKIAESKDFKHLISIRSKFTIIALLFSFIFYFSLPLTVGYLPQIMNRKVFGSINLAYLFALSQFFVAWIIAGIYAKVANNHFDPLAKKIIEENTEGGNKHE